MHIPFPPAFRVLLLFASLVPFAACTTVGRDIATGKKGAILVHHVVESDAEDELFRPKIDVIYGMYPRILSETADRHDETYPSADYLTIHQERSDHGKHESTWYVLSLEPGAYILAGVKEWKSTGIGVWNQAGKQTWFTVDAPKEDDEANTKPIAGEFTPRFQIKAGQVTYIGTFKSQVKTNVGQPDQWPLQVTSASKSYLIESDRARNELANSSLSNSPLETVNLFASKPRSLQVFETPWTSDEDETLTPSTGGPTARPVASR